MRIAFSCSILLIMLGMMFAQAIPNTDTTIFFSDGSLQIQKNLIVKPAGFVSSATGAALEKHESIVTIIIRNAGSMAKEDLQITEDLTYVPANVGYSFNIRPTMQENYAIWKIQKIGINETIHLRFSVPAIISDTAFEASDAPQISYIRTPAVLSASQSSELGSSIKISLKSTNGIGIANAFVQVAYPNGDVKLVETDSSGNVRIIAQQLGTYTFSAPDYELKTTQKTKVVNAPPPTKKPTEQSEPKPQPSENQGIDIMDSLSDMWMIIIIPIAVIFAFLAYRYLSSPVEEEDVPLPPAPATRPAIREEMGERNAAPEIEQKPQFQRTGPSIEYEAPKDTQSLLAKRRVAKEEDEKKNSSQKQIDQIIEQTKQRDVDYSPIAHGDEIEHKERLRRLQQEEKDAESEQEELPVHEEGDSETEQIDEDAIRKTIEELEQLREELKGKADSVDEDLSEEIRELDEQEPAKLDSIIKSAQKSEREKVLDDDIGVLLDEDDEKPLKIKKSRGRPKGATKKTAVKSSLKKGPSRPKKAAKVVSKAVKKKGPGRPPKKKSRGRPSKKK